MELGLAGMTGFFTYCWFPRGAREEEVVADPAAGGGDPATALPAAPPGRMSIQNSSAEAEPLLQVPAISTGTGGAAHAHGGGGGAGTPTPGFMAGLKAAFSSR